MAYRPTPAGPRNIRELFHYLWRELTKVGDAIDAGGGGGGGGEANITSNVGGGAGLALPKVGITLPFKTLVAGSNVTLLPGSQTITISAAGGGGTGGDTNIDGGGPTSIYTPPQLLDGGAP